MELGKFHKIKHLPYTEIHDPSLKPITKEDADKFFAGKTAQRFEMEESDVIKDFADTPEALEDLRTAYNKQREERAQAKAAGTLSDSAVGADAAAVPDASKTDGDVAGAKGKQVLTWAELKEAKRESKAARRAERKTAREERLSKRAAREAKKEASSGSGSAAQNKEPQQMMSMGGDDPAGRKHESQEVDVDEDEEQSDDENKPAKPAKGRRGGVLAAKREQRQQEAGSGSSKAAKKAAVDRESKRDDKKSMKMSKDKLEQIAKAKGAEEPAAPAAGKDKAGSKGEAGGSGFFSKMWKSVTGGSN